MLKSFLLTSLLAIGIYDSKSQSEKPTSDSKSGLTKNVPFCLSYYDYIIKAKVYTQVEIEAEFPGGSAAWQRFLNKNLCYPQDQIDDENCQSKTVANFIVKADGSLCCFGIRDNIDTTRFTSFDKMFLSIIKKSGKWKPAICNGKAVASLKKQSIIVCFSQED